MENSLKYVASESFSYSWLLNETPPSLKSTILDDQDTTFLNFSKRFLELESQNFNFDINPTFLLFMLMKYFQMDILCLCILTTYQRLKQFVTLTLVQFLQLLLHPFMLQTEENRENHVVKSWSRGNSRKGSKVDDFERKVLEIDSRNSPMRSPSHCIDTENTISEAILHCKRSFGMLNDLCD
ncbi:hypothetical protein H5410_050088 [Solanum commersonii]|uniref:Uncharacterized protein n=1 Tax=Solanum commersonii TaxID=4109 RepID=A0A9J5WW24_SOLCO|nr:hypothetical protein H5410_050088 [Solanum commersonii]